MASSLLVRVRCTPSASSAPVMSCGASRTGWKGSPASASRFQIVSIVKSLGRISPSSTSSHVTGVETVAPGSGRSDQALEMFAPGRFMLWSTKTLPSRFFTSHSIVTRSGSAERSRYPTFPTRSRISSYEKPGRIGT